MVVKGFTLKLRLKNSNKLINLKTSVHIMCFSKQNYYKTNVCWDFLLVLIYKDLKLDNKDVDSSCTNI